MKRPIIFSNSFKLTICTLIDNKFKEESKKNWKKISNRNVHKMFQLFEIDLKKRKKNDIYLFSNNYYCWNIC